MTNMRLLAAAAAALTIAASSAFAAAPNYPASAQPVAPQAQANSEASQTDPMAGGSVYQPNVAANPGETPHVIGGQLFYYGGDTESASDGANN